MIIKKISDVLNERYKPATEFKINSFGWKYDVRNCVDDVFDHIINIIEDVNGISEKDFTTYDNLKKYMETYFDNNQDILLEIDELNNQGKRYQLISEILYDKHFKIKQKIDD